MTDSAAAAAAAAAPRAVIVDIDRNNCRNCSVKGGLLSETKPVELSYVPTFAWDELKNALNPMLRKYNSIRLAILSMAAFIVVAYVTFYIFRTFNESEVEKDYTDDDRGKDDDDNDDYYGNDKNSTPITSADIIFVFIFVMLAGLIKVLQQLKTRKIKEIVSKFRPQFASNGVHIVFEHSNSEYRTEVRQLVFSPATTTSTAVPVAVASNATSNTTTAADVESPSPQFSSAPVYTTAANQGKFGKTTTTTTTSTMFDDNKPSVVDQMMADLNKPL